MKYGEYCTRMQEAQQKVNISFFVLSMNKKLRVSVVVVELITVVVVELITVVVVVELITIVVVELITVVVVVVELITVVVVIVMFSSTVSSTV